MLNVCAAKFGGLTPMLTRFPHHFVLENDPPFNHVSLTDSHFATAYKLMVLEAGLSKQAAHHTTVRKTAEEIEAEFVRHTAAILIDAPSRTLKVCQLTLMLCCASVTCRVMGCNSSVVHPIEIAQTCLHCFNFSGYTAFWFLCSALHAL